MESHALSKDKKYHFYISRSQNEDDIRWVTKLTSDKNVTGCSIYSHENDFNPDLSISMNIRHAMTLSERILLILSPYYIASKVCQLETETALKLHLPIHQSIGIIPIIIRECKLPDCLTTFQFIDATNPDKEFLPKLLESLSKPKVNVIDNSLPKGKLYHAFFIYRTVFPDKDWVKDIAHSLESTESGLKCAYHERDFIPGLTIFENITYFLKCSMKVVVVLTPDFLNSSWTKYETELAQVLSMTTSSDVRIIPVVIQDCDIPERLMNLTYLDATDAHQTWWPRLLKTINKPNCELLLQPPPNSSEIQTLKLGRYGGKCHSDLFKSWLIDIKFLDCGSLLVTDARNKKLKKVTFRGQVEHDLLFESRPMFFTCFEDKTAYVTFPDEPCLRVVQTVNKLEVVDKMVVPIQCSGIAKINQMYFALICRPKSKIYIMSRSCTKMHSVKPLIGINEMTQTSVGLSMENECNDSDEEANNRGHNDIAGKKDFPKLQQQRCSIKNMKYKPRLVWPGFIDASGKHIFVTDYETCLLTVIEKREDDTYYHKSVPLVDPRGVTVYKEKLYVAAGSIRMFDLGCESIREIPMHGGPLTFPRSITFDKTGHYMAVTHKGDGDDFFSIYQMLST